MKYIRPHLSPDLRAQITPHFKRERGLTTAGVFFIIASIVLIINLLPESERVSSSNNNDKPENPNLQQILGASTAEELPSTPEFTSYTVVSGDTLFNISQKYNVNWDLIAEVNQITQPYLLHAGQVLKIPQTTTSQVPDKIYTIQSGDTLISIAKQFNITVDDIIAVNPNLQASSLITVGQVIKLP